MGVRDKTRVTGTNPFITDWQVRGALRFFGSLCVPGVWLVCLLGIIRLIQGLCVFFVTIEFQTSSVTLERLVEQWGERESLLKLVSIGPGDSHVAISMLVGALEFFLLAPLFYLQVRALADFVENYWNDSEQDSVNQSGDRPDGVSEFSPGSKLVAVKALSVGLLIAILATHLLGKFLMGHGSPSLSGVATSTNHGEPVDDLGLVQHVNFDKHCEVLTAVALILALTFYYRVLARSHS